MARHGLRPDAAAPPGLIRCPAQVPATGRAGTRESRARAAERPLPVLPHHPGWQELRFPLRIRGLWRVRRAARWLRKAVVPEVLILMYHRVADLPLDPHLLAVRPERFAEHLEVLRQRYRPVRLQRVGEFLAGQRRFRRLRGLDELAASFRPNRPPRKAVVITFDDGFADNLYNAKPLLDQFDIPATVFVTTGHIGEEREFWWDELERHLLEPGTLPATLTLRIDGETLQWSLGEASQYSQEEYERDRRTWTGEVEPVHPRQRLFLELTDRLRPLRDGDQKTVLDQLTVLTGKRGSRPTHRTMTSDEVKQLADGGLIEVGAHTMTHPSLAAHPVDVQRKEILLSKKRLEDILGEPVTSFAFPFGTVADYTEESLAILREGSFRANCTTTPGLVKRTSDPLQLPRVAVRDWDGDTFARRMAEWFHE